MKNFTFKTMMVIGMMALGTVTTFAKGNVIVQHDKHHNGQTTVVVVDKHHGKPDFHARHGMDRKAFRHHMKEGRHTYGPNKECTVCHMTKKQVHKMEKEMSKRHKEHMASKGEFRHHHK